MAPVQNTFSIIPDLPSALNGARHGSADGPGARTSRPPMTTKQAKKAYQKANKGSKLSKAEQRRQELFEQDRIRKEFEKERNQARARAARDKKREKEERERAEKKKKGLPLVDVRPSQDTIARFVRVKPKSQTNSAASPSPSPSPSPPPLPLCEDGGGQRRAYLTPHNAAELCQEHQPDSSDKENVRTAQDIAYIVPVDTNCRLCDTSPVLGYGEPPSKKRRVGDKEHQPSAPVIDREISPSPKHDPALSVAGDRAQGAPGPHANPRGQSVHDSFSTIDLSEENFFDDLLREMDDASSSLGVSEERIPGQQRGQTPPTQTPPPKPPEDSLPSPKKTERPPSQPAPSRNPVSGITKTPRQNFASEHANHGLIPHPVAAPQASYARDSQRFTRTLMAPPPVPSKLKAPGQIVIGHPNTPQFLKTSPLPPRAAAGGSYQSRVTKPKHSRENELPPSTQSFILSHLEDFLPSPSQEVREIFEEPRERRTIHVSKTELTVTGTSAKDVESTKHISRMPATSQHSSVKLTPNIISRGSCQSQQVADHPGAPKVTMGTPIQPMPRPIFDAFEMPFFSTQDMLLSSQDVKDIEEEPLSPPNVPNPIPAPGKDRAKPRDTPRRSPKPLFTSTCRELHYKYALERSRTAAWEGPIARQKAREELDRLQALEDERLEALLASPSPKPEDINTAAVATGTGLDEVRGGPAATSLRRTPPPQVQPRGACNKRVSNLDSQVMARKHTQGSPGVRRPRPGSGGSGTSQRSTRPKSSYEAMLELLAKGPKQKPDTHVPKGGANEDRGGDQTEAPQAVPAFSASQETDYDCGEEWDDDLLCDMP